jgi:hypothetical protein
VLIRSDGLRAPISCRNGEILRIEFLACGNRADRFYPDETYPIALQYAQEYQPRRISRFEPIRVTAYMLPFRAKTARLCGLDPWHAGTVPFACIRMKLVGWHCSILRSTYVKGFLV